MNDMELSEMQLLELRMHFVSLAFKEIIAKHPPQLGNRAEVQGVYDAVARGAVGYANSMMWELGYEG
jgi:hypothetical protein